jgi:hypothetical protein
MVTVNVVSGTLPTPLPNGGYPAGSFVWSISGGNPISSAGYQPSASSATAPVAFTSPNDASATWYFTYPAGSVTVQCVVTPAAPAQPFTVTATVDVAGPARKQLAHRCGTMALLSGYQTLATWKAAPPAPTAFLLWNVTVGSVTTGVYQSDTVLDPSFLSAGSGQWSYVQTKGGHDVLNSFQQPPFSGLDGGFPYGNVPWTFADGRDVWYFMDDPGVEANPFQSPTTLTCLGLPVEYQTVRAYYLYVFYIPPADAAGASIYIPIAELPWFAYGDFSSTDGSSWGQEDNGSMFTAAISYPPFPTW